jgi:TPR repeat protein
MGCAPRLCASPKECWSFFEFGLGVTKDILQASQWYRKAAEQGNIDAQNHLKRLEENATTETVRREAEKV